MVRRAFGRPVRALAGTVGEGGRRAREPGVDAYSGIPPAPSGPAEALDRGGEFLADASECALRLVLTGIGLTSAGTREPPRGGSRRGARPCPDEAGP